MDTIKDTLSDFLSKHNAKLYGDNCIGYRAQIQNGDYLDKELAEIYIDAGGVETCDAFDAACFEFRSGKHNW